MNKRHMLVVSIVVVIGSLCFPNVGMTMIFNNSGPSPDQPHENREDTYSDNAEMSIHSAIDREKALWIYNVERTFRYTAQNINFDGSTSIENPELLVEGEFFPLHAQTDTTIEHPVKQVTRKGIFMSYRTGGTYEDTYKRLEQDVENLHIASSTVTAFCEWLDMEYVDHSIAYTHVGKCINLTADGSFSDFSSVAYYLLNPEVVTVVEKIVCRPKVEQPDERQ